MHRSLYKGLVSKGGENISHDEYRAFNSLLFPLTSCEDDAWRYQSSIVLLFLPTYLHSQGASLKELDTECFGK